jgi:hypothetical protein
MVYHSRKKRQKESERECSLKGLQEAIGHTSDIEKGRGVSTFAEEISTWKYDLRSGVCFITTPKTTR